MIKEIWLKITGFLIAFCLIGGAVVAFPFYSLIFILRDHRKSHDAKIMEARTALPLYEGVKCRQSERTEDGLEPYHAEGENQAKRVKIGSGEDVWKVS